MKQLDSHHKPLRILFAMWSIGRGGVTSSFCVLASYLESLGHEIKVVQDIRRRNESAMQVVPKKYLIGWTPEVRCPIPHFGRVWLWLNCLFNWRFLLRGWLSKKHFNYDCFVLYNGYDLNMYMMRFARKTPSVLWLHEMAEIAESCAQRHRRFGFTSRLRDWSTKKAMGEFDEYVAVSRRAAETQRVAKGLKNTPRVIYNLLDISDIEEKAKLTQSEITRSDAANIIYLGRLSPEKGVDRLFDAIVELHGSVRPFRLWIVGDDYYTSHGKSENVRLMLEREVRDKGLSEIVTFLGDRPNPYPYLKAADLMVLPSRKEGMGIVIWESLVCGTPVVATDSGGPREALKNGRWGAVVENSTDGIKRGILDFLEGRLSFDMDKIRAEVITMDGENRKKVKELFDGIVMRA